MTAVSESVMILTELRYLIRLQQFHYKLDGDFITWVVNSKLP